jgi:hypothetical protein
VRGRKPPERPLVPCLQLSGRRRHGARHTFAQGHRSATHHSGIIAFQSSRRLSLLHPQRELRAAIAERKSEHKGKKDTGREKLASSRPLEHEPHPGSGQVHSLRPMRTHLRGGDGRERHRFHPPGQRHAHRHGLQPRAQYLQLRQLRPVHHGMPHRRAFGAGRSGRSDRGPGRSSNSPLWCSMPRPFRYRSPRSSACRPDATSTGF